MKSKVVNVATATTTLATPCFKGDAMCLGLSIKDAQVNGFTYAKFSLILTKSENLDAKGVKKEGDTFEVGINHIFKPLYTHKGGARSGEMEVVTINSALHDKLINCLGGKTAPEAAEAFAKAFPNAFKVNVSYISFFDFVYQYARTVAVVREA